MTPAHELTRDQFEREQRLKQARALCVEVGLETYGRKPHEMQATGAEWKLARTKALVRQIMGLIT